MSASTMMPMPIPSSSGGTDYDQYKQEYMKSDKAPSDAEKCACCKQKMDLMEQFEFGSAEPENSRKMEAEST